MSEGNWKCGDWGGEPVKLSIYKLLENKIKNLKKEKKNTQNKSNENVNKYT